MSHIIERDIAPPPPLQSYPFGEMLIGDSFLTRQPRSRVAPAASDYGRRHGKRFSVRVDGDALRVWRVG